MLDQIKKSSFKVKWNLREIYKVTEWRKGCVYRTKSLGYIVCAPEYADELRKDKNIQVCPPSTKVSRGLM